jgi:nucleotide-binding universal stress UspA family protein
MYDKILAPVDGSTTSNLGLQEAIKLARLCGARLALVHVVDLMSYNIAAAADAGMTAEVWQALKDGGQEILNQGQAAVQAAGLACETRLVENLTGRVWELVLDEVKRSGANLLVLGTHGRRGVGRMLLGSDAEQIVRHTTVPVLLVRDPATGKAS